jgi:hypothetical protein
MKNIIIVIAAVVLVGAGIWFFAKPSPEEVSPENSLGSEENSSRPMEGQDSFGLDVCSEVPSSLVSGVIGKAIVETENPSTSSGTGCMYFTNKDRYEHILIQVSYLSAENQKKGQEMMDRSITTDSTIPMENFLAIQEDGQINAIYLVMTPQKYVRVDRTSNTADNDQLISLARQVAAIIMGE